MIEILDGDESTWPAVGDIIRCRYTDEESWEYEAITRVVEITEMFDCVEIAMANGVYLLSGTEWEAAESQEYVDELQKEINICKYRILALEEEISTAIGGEGK
jgi:hypothetical protein